MGAIAKYNTFKGVSTVLTLGTPIVTLALCGDFFIHRSETAISVAGIFVILISLLLFKEKIAENWKTPSAFVVSVVLLILILLVEHIIAPVKYVCVATIASTGIDEISFKRFYKNLEMTFPNGIQGYKRAGFLFTTTKTLNELK